ncbi:MAG: acylphosphatase, partial [Methylosarcina sp.]
MTVEGLVQGVGMRPFVFRLAVQYGQNGWVANTPEGLRIAIEGSPCAQRKFLDSLRNDLPPLANIVSLAADRQPPVNYREFRIIDSTVDGSRSAFVLPDLAVCGEC